MREGKVHWERAKGLPACLLSSKTCSTSEKCCCILTTSGLFQPCGCVCGETGQQLLDPAADVSQGQAGCTGPHASISLPRLWLTGKQSAQKPWPHQAEGKSSYFQKSECFVSVSHSINSTPAPSIGSLPKQQSERSIEAPYIPHVIPCLNPV